MLKRYDIKSDKRFGDGWAIIVIDTSIAYFSTVSDFGNYAFCWGSGPGMEFRRFLMQVHEDYLGSKLMQGRKDHTEYDNESTKRAIFEYLRELARDSYGYGTRDTKRWAFYARERDLYRRARDSGDFWNQGDFDEWYRETQFSDAYEFQGEVLNRQFQGFYKRVWPRFVELLRAELAAEDKRVEDKRVPYLEGIFSAPWENLTSEQKTDAVLHIKETHAPHPDNTMPDEKDCAYCRALKLADVTWGANKHPKKAAVAE